MEYPDYNSHILVDSLKVIRNHEGKVKGIIKVNKKGKPIKEKEAKLVTYIYWYYPDTGVKEDYNYQDPYYLGLIQATSNTASTVIQETTKKRFHIDIEFSRRWRNKNKGTYLPFSQFKQRTGLPKKKRDFLDWLEQGNSGFYNPVGSYCNLYCNQTFSIIINNSEILCKCHLDIDHSTKYHEDVVFINFRSYIKIQWKGEKLLKQEEIIY